MPTRLVIPVTITAGMTMTEMAQLQLWRLISPMLPIGAYAYSTGLEYAIDAQWVRNETDAYNWIRGVLCHTVANTDIPIMLRCHAAWQANDQQQVNKWNNHLLAMRESRELQMEDQQLGRALAKILMESSVPHAGEWYANQRISFAATFALACAHWQIPVVTSAQGLAFAWCENQVAAAIKLVPLGQSAGQRILSKLLNDISAAVTTGLSVDDDDIGLSAPGLAIGSARHEMQYSRLFRS